MLASSYRAVCEDEGSIATCTALRTSPGSEASHALGMRLIAIDASPNGRSRSASLAAFVKVYVCASVCRSQRSLHAPPRSVLKKVEPCAGGVTWKKVHSSHKWR